MGLDSLRCTGMAFHLVDFFCYAHVFRIFFFLNLAVVFDWTAPSPTSLYFSKIYRVNLYVCMCGVPEEAGRASEIPWSHVSVPSFPALFGSVFTMHLLTVLWSPFQQLCLVYAVFAVPT